VIARTGPTLPARAVAALWFAAFGGIPALLARPAWPPLASMAFAGAWLGVRILLPRADEFDAFRLGAFTGALAAVPGILAAAIPLRPGFAGSPAQVPWLYLGYLVVWGIVPCAVVGGFAGWTLWLSRYRLGFDRRKA